MTTFADYCAIEAVNWSSLKEMSRSPLHYRWHLEHPTPDTPAMQFGRAAHCAALEPDEFARRYVLWPDAAGHRYGKAWDEFCAANEGKEALREADYGRALAVRDAVRANQDAHALLEGCQTEVTLTWTDAETDIACKARLDAYKPDALIDLKTSADIEAQHFGRTAARLLYHGQLAYYHAGACSCAGLVDLPVRIIAVEAEPPHDVCVYEVSDDDLWAGMELVQDLLAQLRRCRDTDSWLGRYVGPQPLWLPGWVFAEGGGDDFDLQVGPQSAYVLANTGGLP